MRPEDPIPCSPPSPAERSPAPEQPATFRRPRLRRLGALPAVTTAFGGSFSP
ncbi:MAG: hypothetical protein H6735_11035 [Alphaproteobacteria bacterium]|nr:hypothetical protein [Alphaproteobacteria bacterium]